MSHDLSAHHDGETPRNSAPLGVELIMVAYHSRRHVEDFLQAFGDDWPMAVVDNAQGADHLEEVLAGRPATRYLAGPARGFAAGANAGAHSSASEVVVFVNPDSRPDPALISELVEDVRRDPTLAASAAMPVGADGRAEHGVGGWDFTPRRVLVHAFGLHKVLRRGGMYAQPDLREAIDVDWATGTCMAVRREVFDQLNGFDESYFVYCEDVDFGCRARRVGLRSRLRTDLPVPHAAGSSGGGSLTMERIKGASLHLYLERRNGRGVAHLLGGALSLAFYGRVLMELAVRRRPEVARKHVAFARGLVGGLPSQEVAGP